MGDGSSELPFNTRVPLGNISNQIRGVGDSLSHGSFGKHPAVMNIPNQIGRVESDGSLGKRSTLLNVLNQTGNVKGSLRNGGSIGNCPWLGSSSNLSSQLGKRKFVSVGGTNDPKCNEGGHGYMKILADKAGNANVMRKVPRVDENLIKGRWGSENVKDGGAEKVVSSFKAKELGGSVFGDSFLFGGRSKVPSQLSDISAVKAKELGSSYNGDNSLPGSKLSSQLKDVSVKAKQLSDSFNRDNSLPGGSLRLSSQLRDVSVKAKEPSGSYNRDNLLPDGSLRLSSQLKDVSVNVKELGDSYNGENSLPDVSLRLSSHLKDVSADAKEVVGLYDGENSLSDGTSRVPSQLKEFSSLLGGNHCYVWGDAFPEAAVVPGQSESIPVMIRDNIHEERGVQTADIASSPTWSNSVNDVVATQVFRIDGDDVTSNKSSSIGCSILSGSSSSTKVLEPEKCTAFIGGNVPNTSAVTELPKDCSCSFCLKAAYIWSDLHYQDTKARIAALKRSRKEVQTVLDKSRNHLLDRSRNHTNNSAKLETDLMLQWRSLFLYTEGTLGQESASLQSNLVNLKDLRDNCKKDLWMAPTNNP